MKEIPCIWCGEYPQADHSSKCLHCQRVYGWYRRMRNKYLALGLVPSEMLERVDGWFDYMEDYFENRTRFSHRATL